MDTLPVNQIIPFSNVDGEGNRLSIFVQGCNLNCVYCHNSETIQHCRHCGVCVDACPTGALTVTNQKVVYEKNKCIHCDQCILVCPYQSTPKSKNWSLSALLEEIEVVKPYIRGITISGGEPTLYSDFIVNLAKEVKAMGLSCYIDTNGLFDLVENEAMIEAVDGFLFDVKSINQHKRLCGVENKAILKNLNHLLLLNKIIEVRTVILKSPFNMDETIVAVKDLLKNHPHVPYRLINVHLEGLKEEQKHNIKPSMMTNKEFNAIKMKYM